MGLADMAQSAEKPNTSQASLPYDKQRSGANGERPAPGRAVVGTRSAPGRAAEIALPASLDGGSRDTGDDNLQSAPLAAMHHSPSYRSELPLAVVAADAANH